MKTKIFIIVYLVLFALTLGVNAATIYVNPGDNLNTQINNAVGGDILLVASGTYGSVKIENKYGTAQNPIVVKSMPDAQVIIGGSSWITLEIINCSYLVFEGLELNRGGTESAGLWIKDSDHIIFKNNKILQIGQVGIHVSRSEYIDIIHNEIGYTGRTQPAYGEGIYIGTGSTSASFPDRNDYIWIEGNLIYECGYGEGINIKSEVFHCTVKGNTVHHIHPSTSSQLNQAAISINDAYLSVLNNYMLTTSRDVWVENNTVHSVSGGQRAGWNNGIFFGGSGVNVLNNIVYDCADYGIIGHHWNNLGIQNHVYGNSVSGCGTNMYINPVLNVSYSNPGPNPHGAQTWYGDPVDPVAVTGVSINESSLTVSTGQSGTLTATVSPADATNKSLSWSSSNEAIATVNSIGQVTGVGAGTCTITVTTDDGGFTDNVEITVEAGPMIHSVSAEQTPNVAANILDGDNSDDSRWSAESFPQWVIIDYGEMKNIIGAKLWTYQDRAYQYTVEASSSPTSGYTLIVDRTANTSAEQPISDNFSTVQARYIKITCTGASGYTGTWTSLNEFEIVEGTSEDNDPPSIPTGLNSSNITTTGFTLNWSASTDNIGVTGYEVFKDGASVGTTSGTSMLIDGLSPETTYSMTVRARDAVPNWSAQSSALDVATLAQGTDLINEPFTSSPASNFTTVGGTWDVSGGEYILTNPVTGDVGSIPNKSIQNTTLSGDWTLTVDASVTATTSEWNDFVVIFGYQDASNYYFVSFNESNDNYTSGIFKYNSGVLTEMADITSAISGGTSYAIKIVKEGSSFNVYRNTVLMATANDATWASGKVGLGSFNDAATFDNLIVTGDEGTTDIEAPTVPDGLVANNISSTDFTLNWTASTDNVGVTGYEVFKDGVSVGATTGTTMSVTGLTAATSYGMQVRARDAVPNWSAKSTVLNVTTSSIAVTGVSVTPSATSINIGATTTLTATVIPSDATNKNVSWSSDNSAVATVNNSGVVTGISAGSATITVATQDGNKTATCAVEVTDIAETNIALNKVVSASAWQDDSYGYNPPSNLVDGDISDDSRWSVSGFPQWAEIDLGSNYIISTFEVYTYQDRAYQYTIEVKAEGGSYTTVVDRSSNTTVPPIIDNATVSGRYVKITVTGASGYSGSWISVTELMVYGVESDPVPVTGISLDSSTLSLTEGGSQDLTETVLPENASNKSVTWSTSNNAIATVDEYGLVTGVSEGTATITVTTVDGAYTASSTVTVNPNLGGDCEEYAIPAASNWIIANSWNDKNNGSVVTNTSDALKYSHRAWGQDHVYLMMTGESFKIYSGEIYDISFDVKAASEIVSIETGFASAYTSTGPTAYSVPLSVVASGYSSTSFSSKTKSVTATGTDLNSVFVIKINLSRSANIQEYFFKNLSLCSNGSSLKSAEITLSVENTIYSELDVQIYPNPSSDGKFVIKVTNADEVIEMITITDIDGRLLMQENANRKGQVEMNTRDILMPGFYIIAVKTSNSFINKRLIINKK